MADDRSFFRTATIGGCRMFVDSPYWRLPEVLLVVAGCFSKYRASFLAAMSQSIDVRTSTTKHYYKAYLFRAKDCGLRPPAEMKMPY